MDKKKQAEIAERELRKIYNDEAFNGALHTFGKGEFENAKPYVQSNEEMMPKIIVVSNKKVDGKNEVTIAMFANGFGDPDEKQKLLMGFGAKLYDQGIQPVALFITSEVWMSRGEDLKKDMAPSQDPKHREGIMISGMTVDGRQNFAMAMIEEKDGKRDLGEPDYTEFDPKDRKVETESYLLKWVYQGYALTLMQGMKGKLDFNEDINENTTKTKKQKK